MKKAVAVFGFAVWIASCATPTEILQERDIRVSGDRIFLPVTINGSPTEALLDSGAEMTLVDAAFASGIGLVGAGQQQARGTGAGTQDVQFAEGVEIGAAGATMTDQFIAIIDLEDVSRRLVGEPLTAVLGREIFDRGRYFLDIESGIFQEVSPDAVPEGIELALSEANGIKQVPVRINNGRQVLADFDLGNGSEILLSKSFAEQAGLLAEGNVIGTKEGGGIGGAVEQTLVHVDTLDLGGVVLHDLVAAVGNASDGADMNIGVSVLRKFRMVIDFSQDKIWLVALP